MIMYVNLSQITDNPFQSRQEYGDIEELAADIARHYDTRPDTLGLQQVPSGRVVFRSAVDYKIVRPDELTSFIYDNTLAEDRAITVQLEFGHRRLRAFRYLQDKGEPGYAAVMPVNILYLTDDDMLDGVWSENSARKNLSAVEEAELLARKLESAGSQAEVAKAWGLARSTVANKLRLLELPQEVQEANRTGRLSERQALNLLPLLKLQEQIEQLAEKPEFSPQLNGNHWGPPAGPELVIKHILENPDTSSDDIRQFTTRIEDHATWPLADVVATFNPKPAPAQAGVRQYPCKGCPLRTGGNRCLDSDCLGAKLELVKVHLVNELSAATGLPISDSAKHFNEPATDWNDRTKLQSAWAAGYRENMVVGWWDRGHAFRPDGRFRHVIDRETVADPENGLAIGYTPGRIDEALLAFLDEHAPAEESAGEPVEPHHDQLPGRAQIGDWTIAAENIIRDIQKQGREAIREHLESLDPDTLGFVSLLIAGKESEPGREVATFMQTSLARNATTLADWYKPGVPGEWAEKLAGLGLSAAPTPPESLAVMVLADWFGGRRESSYYLGDRDKQTIRHIFDLTHAGANQLAADRPDLATWLDVARVDAAWWLSHYFADDRDEWPDIPELVHLIPEVEEEEEPAGDPVPA